MASRAYILLDISDGESDEVIRNLEGKSGVVIVDPLEGPPDVLMVVEASDRQELAELAMQAIASVETIAKGVHVLPVHDGLNAHI